MTNGDKPYSGSRVAERWVWVAAGVITVLALITYFVIDRGDLYRINLDWWVAVLKWMVGV